MTDETQKPPSKRQDPNSIVGAPDARYVYANNFFFKGSVWDLSLLFGQLTNFGERSIEYHTSVTMTYPSAKLLSFFLLVNVALREVTEAISVPQAMIPDPPPQPSGDSVNDPRAWEFYNFCTDIYERFFRVSVPRATLPKAIE